jgi:hypothetical protein
MSQLMKTRFTTTLLRVILAAVFLLGVSPPLFAQEADDQRTRTVASWTSGYTLILLDVDSLEEAYETADFIQRAGGLVAIIASPHILLGWVPRALDRELIGEHGIQSLYRTPVSLSTGAVEEANTVSFFNQVASGRWEQQKQALAPGPAFQGPDGLEAPPLSHADFLQNLRAAGLAAEDIEALSPGNSDNMIGKVNFNAIFVESTGGCEFGANLYTWTSTDISTIQSEIIASLSFWSSQAPTYGVPLTWVTSFWTLFNTTGVLTCYEPIQWSSGADGLWIQQIMCNFGFCSGDKFALTTAFNAARRVAAQTNWAVTSFIGYNPAPAPTTFTDGLFAYAYGNGPYSQLLFRNDGWAVNQYDLVNAHETGHLFGAADQYASSGCNNCFIAGNNSVFNGNCANCNAASVPSIMRNNELALDGYCPGQIGWAVLVNFVQPIGVASFNIKTNYTPGQAFRPLLQVQLPGRPDSLGSNTLVVTTRWFLQYPGGVTQSFGPFTLNLLSGYTWNVWVDNVSIPTTAAFGEATLEAFIEVANYGKGGRASGKGGFYIVGSGANPIPTAPAQPEVNAELVAQR